MDGKMRRIEVGPICPEGQIKVNISLKHLIVQCLQNVFGI